MTDSVGNDGVLQSRAASPPGPPADREAVAPEEVRDPIASAAVLGPFTMTEAMLEAWGERVGAGAAVPLVLALRGQLGAGKSVLARAIARGAGVAGHMPSPTFNLLYRYRAARGIDVVHLDLYRLEDPGEVWELGWAELGDGDEIVLVEWPERAEALLPPDRWDVWLEIPAEESTVRTVRAERRGGAFALPAPAAVEDSGAPLRGPRATAGVGAGADAAGQALMSGFAGADRAAQVLTGAGVRADAPGQAPPGVGAGPDTAGRALRGGGVT